MNANFVRFISQFVSFFLEENQEHFMHNNAVSYPDITFVRWLSAWKNIQTRKNILHVFIFYTVLVFFFFFN